MFRCHYLFPFRSSQPGHAARRGASAATGFRSLQPEACRARWPRREWRSAIPGPKTPVHQSQPQRNRPPGHRAQWHLRSRRTPDSHRSPVAALAGGWDDCFSRGFLSARGAWRRGLCAARSAADRDVALPRLGSQPLDLLRQAAEAAGFVPCTADSVVEEAHLWERLPDRGPLGVRVAERSVLISGIPVQHRLVQPSSQQVDADLSYLVGSEAKDLADQGVQMEVAVRPTM